jgi:hypothetical protein
MRGRGGVKSPTFHERWSEAIFIRGGNPDLTSQFCRVELGTIAILIITG